MIEQDDNDIYLLFTESNKRIESISDAMQQLQEAVKYLIDSNQLLVVATTQLESLRRDESRQHDSMVRVYQRLESCETSIARHDVWVAIISSLMTTLVTALIGSYFI